MSATVSKASAGATKGKGNVTKLARRDASPSLKIEPNRVYQLAPGLIHVEEGYNVRTFDPGREADLNLARSILATGGVQTPLTVRQDESGKVWLVAGHRRLAAVHYLAKLPKGGKVFASVPAMLASSDVSKDDVRTADIFVSNSGQPLTPMEQARVAARLKAKGYEPAGIAKVGGFTPKYASMLLEMAELPAQIQEWVARGYVTATLAWELSKELDKGAKDAPATIAAIRKALDVQAKQKGFGADLRVTRKHVEAVLPKGATLPTPPAAQRAPQQPVATPAPAGDGKAVQVSAHDRAEPGKGATPAKPAEPSKPATERYRALGMALVDGQTGTRFATFTRSSDAESVATFLNQHGWMRPAG